jgi:hypothetical protein
LFFTLGIVNTVMFYLLCLLMLIVIIFFIVKLTAPKYTYNIKNKILQKKDLLILLIFVFVVITALVYGVFGLPYVPTPNSFVPESNDSKLLQWAEDTSYTFNISGFIESPDMIPYVFNVTSTKHIQSTVQDDVVIFVPEKDWYGEESISFIATDAFGESVKSSPVTLKVIDVPELTTFDYAKPWFWTFNLLVFLLILAIFFFCFVVANRRPKRK